MNDADIDTAEEAAAAAVSEEDRLEELEVKVAFQQKTIEELNEALVQEGRAVMELADRVRVLEEALGRVARGGAAVAGALPEDDPVPSSG